MRLNQEISRNPGSANEASKHTDNFEIKCLKKCSLSIRFFYDLKWKISDDARIC